MVHWSSLEWKPGQTWKGNISPFGAQERGESMTKQTIAITRAVGVIGATLALVAGVTFANLTSNNVTLTANQLSTATASLKLVDGANANALVTTLPGFNFVNLLPGVESSAFVFKLNNDGTSPLNISATFPDLSPSVTGIALTKIHLKIAAAGSLDPAVNTTLDLLSNTSVVLPGSPVGAGATQSYNVTATIDPTYVGAGGTLAPFTLTFTGTQP
jgi:hypothetical protein